MGKKLIYAFLVMALFGSVAVWAQDSPYDRVAYWDSDYGTAWAGDGSTVRDALEAVGYRVVNADELKVWMNARISDGALSVVVMCRDAVPDTVAETMDDTCTIRRYLNAGGKVVWYSDIPFYYQTTTGGANTTWGDSGSTSVLGFGGSTATRDVGDTVTITEDGERWGLVTPWSSVRPTLPDAWPDLTILAVNEAGNASGWVAHYVPGDTFRGFVRIEDHSGAPIDMENLIAVAEYVEYFTAATGPSPGNETDDVVRDIVLGWTPGDFAASHDVYFGTSFEDVNTASRSNPRGVLVSEGQTEATYDPDGLLEFGQTYYWRIDEVNAAPDNTVFKGGVWSFTAEPFAYAIENITATSNVEADDEAGPENTINGSGLNSDDQHSLAADDMWLTVRNPDSPYIQYDFNRVYKLHEMWVWNYNVQFESVLGFGCKDVTVEYSVDGVEWTVLGDAEFAQGVASDSYEANTTVDLQGIAAQYIRLSINSRWGEAFEPQYGLSEVRFFYIPAHPREPEPADGTTGVDVNTTLAWRAGRDATAHEVYFGTDPEALELAATSAALDYDPGDLDLDVTYYWQVVAVQDTESWESVVWSFVTQGYLVVDGFESYNDVDNLIYETWEDGWYNGTGSTVGYFEEPFAETTIVHSGVQSMPLFYDNSDADTSEADFSVDQDWTAHGIKSLSLYFHGDADSSGGQLFVRINNTEIDYDGPAVNLSRPGWQLWNIDLSEAGNVSNVNTLTIGVKGDGAQGIVYIDDIELHPEVIAYLSDDITGAGDTVQGVPNDGVTTGNNDNGWPSGETPDLVIDDNAGTKFLHFKGNLETTGFQVTPLLGATTVTGLTFTSANDAAERDPTSFELYGSNDSIDGPYTLIASGDIVDFAGETAWERLTKTTTPITFDNDVAYTHYQVLFPTIRDADTANSMQIAEVELIGVVAP